ncbi:MAG TPA: CopG family transcriptional regulator [Acidimicrobiales bacterium]|nr:CopG family transcriptional regulator [Acidimicrobiales bacterium]
MAMNLRLGSEAEDALRREAQRTGRSQQEVVREAVNRHLGLVGGERPRSELGVLIATGTVRPPRTPYRKVTERLRLPPGTTTADLLDRGDRI